MTQAGVELSTSTGYRLKEASAALRAAMEAVLGPLDLTVTQYSSLELLAQRPGLSSSELARGTFVTRQSMSLVLQGLERAGLIAKPVVAPHGRALPVELTALGRTRLAAASAAVRSVEDRMLSGIATSDRARLGDLLARCITALRT